MVSLDDAAVRLRLAGLDHLIFVVGDEELEAVLGGRANGDVRENRLEGLKDNQEKVDQM